ncbi:toll/interleukin-1 receptor domain-containing protein [Thiothrix subterranea]|uniref:toll/interleukin-1 receptor domain-containing protein n=1 Tax=Thiothrix subterranea TaxID=2735563 RepID=UPI00192AA67B|nr:toll/interleukin-1 receptor domain-containing protein [Thiothrix subterranea]QQZ30095.1 toll/interleukin-1 receptor domain-containing protein [Thiothrix subterranea]
MQQIFISYAQDESHGQRLAKEVQQQLHEQGFRVFRDETGVIAGMQWVKEIESQLKASQLVVLVVSSKVQHSEWVFAEFQMARNMGIPVVPVLAEVLPDMPLWLIPLRHLNFSSQPDWQRLMHTIGTYIPLPTKSQPRQPHPSVSPLPSPQQQTQPSWAKAMGEDGYGRYDDVDGITVIRKGARDVYGGYDDVDGITVIRKGARR